MNNELPPDEYVVAVRSYAHAFARGVNRKHDEDDIASEAVVALLVLWPRLRARYDQPPFIGMMCRIVRLRLIDYCREQYGGRGGRWKPHAHALPLLPDHDCRTADDPAQEAVDRAVGLDELIQRLSRARGQSLPIVEQTRRLEAIARSPHVSAAAQELGMSVNALGMWVANLRKRVQSDPDLIDTIA